MITNGRTDNTAAETYRTAPRGPLVVTPFAVRPDWCLVELDGETLIVPSALLSFLMREKVVACGCARCVAEAVV